MTVAAATTLETVRQWIAQTEGWQRTQATASTGKSVYPRCVTAIA